MIGFGVIAAVAVLSMLGIHFSGDVPWDRSGIHGWLDRYHGGTPTEQAQAEAAIRAMGHAAAVPLAEDAARNHSGVGAGYRRLWFAVPNGLRQRLPKPAHTAPRQFHALHLLRQLGPEAADAMPLLLAMLERETKAADGPPASVTASMVRPRVHAITQTIGCIGGDDPRIVTALLASSRALGMRLSESTPLPGGVNTLLPALQAALHDLLREADDSATPADTFAYLLVLHRHGTTNTTERVAIAAALLQSPEDHHRIRGALTLKRFTGCEKSVAPRLIAALPTPERFNPLQVTSAPDVHSYAATAFSSTICGVLHDYARRDPSIVPLVTHALTDPAPGIRAGAAFTLGELGLQATNAIPMLARLTETDPDIAVRYHAAQTLHKLDGRTTALRPFKVRELASRSPEVRREAAEFLSRHGAGFAPAISGLAKVAARDEEERVRVAAGQAFWAVGGTAAEWQAAVNEAMRDSLHQSATDAVQVFRAMAP
jgi:HEAT repeat protein